MSSILPRHAVPARPAVAMATVTSGLRALVGKRKGETRHGRPQAGRSSPASLVVIHDRCVSVCLSVMYGRDDATWSQLTEAGRLF